MPPVMATESAPCSSNELQNLPGDIGIGPNIASGHFPITHDGCVLVLGFHNPNSDLRCLAQIWAIECNCRDRPPTHSLARLLPQPLDELICDHVALRLVSVAKPHFATQDRDFSGEMGAVLADQTVAGYHRCRSFHWRSRISNREGATVPRLAYLCSNAFKRLVVGPTIVSSARTQSSANC